MVAIPSYKVIQSGHIVEVLEYQSAIMLIRDDELKRGREGGRDKEGIEDRKEEYRESVNLKAREKVRRLINANFTKNSLFITLTFREDIEIDKANYELKKFLQKVKRKQTDFKYVAVIEFTKNGRPHYHMLCNFKIEWQEHLKGCICERKEKTTCQELKKWENKVGKWWGNGFVDIGYKETDNSGAYLIKYMTKEGYDPRLEGKKRYFFSRNCDKPIEHKGADAIKIIQSLEGSAPVFTSKYYNDFTGEVIKREYNPERWK